jgi:hypothetical protein
MGGWKGENFLKQWRLGIDRDEISWYVKARRSHVNE